MGGVESITCCTDRDENDSILNDPDLDRTINDKIYALVARFGTDEGGYIDDPLDIQPIVRELRREGFVFMDDSADAVMCKRIWKLQGAEELDGLVADDLAAWFRDEVRIREQNIRVLLSTSIRVTSDVQRLMVSDPENNSQGVDAKGLEPLLDRLCQLLGESPPDEGEILQALRAKDDGDAMTPREIAVQQVHDALVELLVKIYVRHFSSRLSGCSKSMKESSHSPHPSQHSTSVGSEGGAAKGNGTHCSLNGQPDDVSESGRLSHVAPPLKSPLESARDERKDALSADLMCAGSSSKSPWDAIMVPS
eukprot:gnl/MRDRNA2_/MRDRNA2_104047_c0_seq1.p1 gnl/MRDRNA2_/MRDRNA2_104047_c0~~gnl/MRDRNA2_/MRDRNA2_104047_c0_seq1.p1  ORF type:complete len:308 (+),score=59.52 gnl/MRDRNA2_/MRDRNA2_104047_c0_seq1:57-980(+)